MQGSPLNTSDFGQLSFTSGGFTELTTNNCAQISLNATGQTWITKGGTTKLALVNDPDMNNLAARRDQIVRRIEQIITAVLPDL